MPRPTDKAPASVKELEALLEHDTKVKVAGLDVDGVFRGKFMSKSKFLSVADDGFGFCSVIFGWDIHDTVYPNELLISNKGNGYHDLIAQVDLSTYRRLPWEENVPFFFIYFLDPDTREPVPVCPRGAVKKAMDTAHKTGWQCMSGVEFEYFQFKETPFTALQKNYTNLDMLTPGMHGYSLLRTTLNQKYFHDLFEVSLKLGVEVEGHHTETGPGVYETALAYTDADRMADNASLFKLIAKSVGIEHGIMPSFMAKPHGNLPGCSGHIHVSLVDQKTKKSIFALSDDEIKAGGRKDTKWPDTRFVSKQCEQFIAGLLDGLQDVMPMLVPTINGYKRLAGGEGFWAPNKLTYGFDSRAASVRILGPPSCSAKATRLEVRIPGADVQPHYAIATLFLLGLRGIEKQLELTMPPVSVQQKDVEAGHGNVTKLPISLEEATARMMRKESVAREIMGDLFVEHIGGTREHEVRAWNEAVTNWELERYLELA